MSEGLTEKERETMKTIDATKLANLYRAVGLDIALIAGPVGIVVYGRTPKMVATTCRHLRKMVTGKLGVKSSIRDKGEETDAAVGSTERFFATLAFDWSAVPETMPKMAFEKGLTT